MFSLILAVSPLKEYFLYMHGKTTVVLSHDYSLQQLKILQVRFLILNK